MEIKVRNFFFKNLSWLLEIYFNKFISRLLDFSLLQFLNFIFFAFYKIQMIIIEFIFRVIIRKNEFIQVLSITISWCFTSVSLLDLLSFKSRDGIF